MLTWDTWDFLGREIVLWLPRFATGITVALFFWLMAEAARRVVRRIGRAQKIDRDLTRFLARTVRVAILLCGAITALGTVGVNVTALVAGLGLTGFALGFALKDIISNMLAGVMILVYKPFRQEDQIEVKSFKGIVERIDLRYTVLCNDGNQIFVPNSILFTNAITVERKTAPSSAVADTEPDN